MGRNSSKSLYIDNCNIIDSDCSRAGVDEKTAIVCLQRQRTDGATAVRRLDDDDCVFCFVCYLVAKFFFIEFICVRYLSQKFTY